MGYAELAGDETVDRKTQLEYLEIIDKEAAFMAEIAHEVLEYSRGELVIQVREIVCEKYFKDLNVDAVVVSRLLAVDQKRDYQSGYLYTVPFSYYYGFYSYYYSGIAYANSSGYLSKDVVVVLETNIYGTDDKQLIWSGISETMDPDKASDVIYSFGETLVSTLKKEGYFK